MSGYFTENSPPKPQQLSRPSISTSSSPATSGEQRARLALDAELAQARAAVVVGDAARIAAGHRVEPAHVDEEGDELVDPLGEGGGLASGACRRQP